MGLKNERLLQQLLMKYHKKPLEELFQLALTLEAMKKELLQRADASLARNGTTVGASRNDRTLNREEAAPPNLRY